MRIGSLTEFVNDMLNDMREGVYDYTVDDRCSNCGSCCSDLLPVSDREMRKIKVYVKEHGIKEQKHIVPTAVPAAFDLTCPFRNNRDRKCMIYEVRPAICRDFQCDKPRKQIEANRSMYHGKYATISMRETFFK